MVAGRGQTSAGPGNTLQNGASKGGGLRLASCGHPSGRAGHRRIQIPGSHQQSASATRCQEAGGRRSTRGTSRGTFACATSRGSAYGARRKGRGSPKLTSRKRPLPPSVANANAARRAGGRVDPAYGGTRAGSTGQPPSSSSRPALANQLANTPQAPANQRSPGGLETRYPSLGGSRVRIPPPPSRLRSRLPSGF
jgi:hypothetical protein